MRRGCPRWRWRARRRSPPRASAGGSRRQLLGSTRGLLSVHVDDGVWLVPAIHAVWLPPHHVHAVRSHGPFHGWSAYIAEHACAALPQRPCTIRPSALLREAVLRAATWPAGDLAAPDARVAAVIVDEIARLPAASVTQGAAVARNPRCWSHENAKIGARRLRRTGSSGRIDLCVPPNQSPHPPRRE
jgi:hypothetical protein